MSDHRAVQCFGIKRRPKKADEICRNRYLWVSAGSSSRFGRKGPQACPNCGNLPDFSHPFNRYRIGELSLEEADAAMEEYLKSRGKEKT